jgi:hypothetical protein
MNNILATATTWTLVSIVSATITVKMIDVSVSQFSALNTRMAEVTGGPKAVQQQKHPTFGTLFEDLDWSPQGGVAEVAMELSERFTLLVTAPACRTAPQICVK